MLLVFFKTSKGHWKCTRLNHLLQLSIFITRFISCFCFPLFCSFIAVENIEKYCVLISSKAVYFLKSGDYPDREAIFLEVKYDDLYHCLVSKDHGKVYVQLTKKAVNTSSGVAMPGPSQQKPMVRIEHLLFLSHRSFFSPQSMHVLTLKIFLLLFDSCTV